MGPFVARIRRKLTQLCPLPTDTWPAWTLQRRCKVQYPPEYRDAAQTGQGLTKKTAWNFQAVLLKYGARGRTRTGTAFATTPSRWRVYQFHHPGTILYSRSRRSDSPAPASLPAPSSIAGALASLAEARVDS